MRFRILLVMLLLSGNVFAHIERTYFLKGKVGERELAIRMLCYDEIPVRHLSYYFIDEIKDKYLLGKFADNCWNFSAEQSGNLNPSIKITDVGNGCWKGFWIEPSGKMVDLFLKPLVTDSIVTPFGRIQLITEMDVYDQFRLSNISFTETHTQKLGNELICSWMVEKQSGISFFKIKTSNHKYNTNAINATLTNTYIPLLQNFLKKSSEASMQKVSTSITYVNDALLAFKIVIINTGQNRNSYSNQCFAIDLTSGAQLSLEDLIWLDKNTKKPASDDLYTIYKYRKSTFAPMVFTWLQQLYPEKINTNNCNLNTPDTWCLPIWGLTNKGIALGLNTSEKCDVLNWAILPYQKLTPFLTPKYHLKVSQLVLKN